MPSDVRSENLLIALVQTTRVRWSCPTWAVDLHRCVLYPAPSLPSLPSHLEVANTSKQAVPSLGLDMPRPSSAGYMANGTNEHDLESGLNGKLSNRNNASRNKDVASLATRNEFHHQLKRKLKDGADGYKLEKYRKSVSEIKDIKDKKIQSFYKAQNERLNDWLEVDMLVNSMADDVLDSMNPQDVDGDGVADVVGKLQETHGDIAPLLPDDEREKRRQGERRAKWAINVSGVLLIRGLKWVVYCWMGGRRANWLTQLARLRST